MSGLGGMREPDRVFLRVAYLRAMVNLYEPWVDLEVLSPVERRRARDLVTRARWELGQLENVWRDLMERSA
ncbi:hypothetical protein LO762_23755 [Actinocorallia sp. API 0066]|uniref:hypothetical protein n=1 Tax=Actinocorallia sp. API 0066 TaxID=2896846 RepID=UPI001E43702B|nr:hypothetical protein [Actinocorallia sp. API 0066]MCD0452184.1 hypothetical protein [Actinocorallia sp. API 0066]